MLHYFTRWYTILHDVTLSYTILHYLTLLYTIIHYLTLWHISLSEGNYFLDNVEARDFNAESRKKKLTRKLHISCLVQKIFSVSQITRSRINKEVIDEKASEKASHPSWSLAITRKYWVVPKPFLARPHCPPLSPPFPPNPVSSYSLSEAVASQNSARSKNGVLEDRSLDASTHPPSRTTSRKKWHNNQTDFLFLAQPHV